MPVSDKQKEYAKKWDRTHLLTLSTSVRREDAEDFKAWCKIQGISTTAAIKQFVMAELDKYSEYMEQQEKKNAENK